MIADGENAAAAYTIGWEPQPGPQTALLACPVFEVFFGGARGGGKTASRLLLLRFRRAVQLGEKHDDRD